jgi:hypothetical protein
MKKRCRNEAWAGSMPTSKACSQLHRHRPLKANVCVSGAVRQLSDGKGAAAAPGDPADAKIMPLRITSG